MHCMQENLIAVVDLELMFLFFFVRFGFKIAEQSGGRERSWLLLQMHKLKHCLLLHSSNLPPQPSHLLLLLDSTGRLATAEQQHGYLIAQDLYFLLQELLHYLVTLSLLHFSLSPLLPLLHLMAREGVCCHGNQLYQATLAQSFLLHSFIKREREEVVEW